MKQNSNEDVWLKKLAKHPRSKCGFCGTISQNVLMTGSDMSPVIIDSRYSSFVCSNPNCIPAQDTLRWKGQLEYIKERIDYWLSKLNAIDASKDYRLDQISAQLSLTKADMERLKDFFNKKELILSNWKWVKEQSQKIWNWFFNWEKENLPFISLQKQFKKNNDKWELSIKLTKWAIFISIFAMFTNILLSVLWKYVF